MNFIILYAYEVIQFYLQWFHEKKQFRTPYWISVMYSLYLEIFQPFDIEMPDPSFIYLMYGVHALPYVNSASNFILYGLLNRQVNFNGKHFLNLEIKLIGSVSTF